MKLGGTTDKLHSLTKSSETGLGEQNVWAVLLSGIFQISNFKFQRPASKQCSPLRRQIPDLFTRGRVPLSRHYEITVFTEVV